MERSARSSVATFFVPDVEFVPGAAISVGPEIVQHMQVRRMATGEPLKLIDGAGHVACAVLVRLARGLASVQIEEVEHLTPLPPIHLLAPIADRDRMLWLAEKCAEFGVTSWRPVLWKRSRSVKPRGEGPTFTGKVRARMASALEQSGGAYLPAVFPDASCDRAIAGTPEGTRLVLDRTGDPIVTTFPLTPPVSIAVGPEGGLDPSELDALERAGFRRVRLDGHVLRFETAAIAGMAIARAGILNSDAGVFHGE